MRVLQEDFEGLDQFPMGMRVLAVDDDQTCLRILQTLLLRCQYNVTITNQAQTALELLRENKNKFDLVISDVDMPDMDGFKLLELVGLEMDLPVIMLSAHSDPKYVMKGVKHGACDYLLKPVRIEELKNIWQHVVRKSKLKKNKKNGGGESYDQNYVKANRKRKDQFEDEEEEERVNENDDPTAQKKPRVLWTRELHDKFLVAVDHLGVENAAPKKILDLMNVDKLTRENVASHLQKFRSALKKITNEANQQANMAAIGSHFMKMSSFKGLGGLHHRPIPLGLGRFHGEAATMRHYPSNSTLGRVNSLAGMFPHVSSSSLPRNHNDGGYILQGLSIPTLEELHINNNNKAFPSFTSQQNSLMVGPNNLLDIEGHSHSSSPFLNPGFSPHFDINKRLDHWSNSVLSTNITESDVHSKSVALDWDLFRDSNMVTKPTSFRENTDYGSSNAAQAEVIDIQMSEQPAKEGLVMGQEKQQRGFVDSEAGSLDDIVNSIMTQEQNQTDFSQGDLGFGWFSSLRTSCI